MQACIQASVCHLHWSICLFVCLLIPPCFCWGLRTIMLDTESQWSEALASNNIRAIIRWLRRLTGDGTFGTLDYFKSKCRCRSWSSYCKKKLICDFFGIWFIDVSNDILLQAIQTWTTPFFPLAAGFRGRRNLLKRSYYHFVRSWFFISLV